MRAARALGLPSTLHLDMSQQELWKSLPTVGVESMSTFDPKPGSEGLVLTQGGISSGRSWRGCELDRWLGEMLESPRGASKVTAGCLAVGGGLMMSLLTPFLGKGNGASTQPQVLNPATSFNGPAGEHSDPAEQRQDVPG